MTETNKVQFLPLIPLGQGPAAPVRLAAAAAPAPVPAAAGDRVSAAAPRAGIPAVAPLSGYDKAMFRDVYIPPGAVKANGKVDVVFHLHGGGGIPYKQMHDLKAVVVSIQPNGKGLSKMFVDHYQATGGFANWEQQLRGYLKAKLGTDQIDRVAVSSFSAGFGGVREVLRSPVNRARIDTVILFDSLHTDNSGLTPDSPGLQPFVEFAREAAAGHKTMVVTHTELDPIQYASTTETARVLQQATGAAERPYAGPQSPIQPQLSQADKGNLHVLGFAGKDGPAHMKQLKLASEVWPKYLAARWNATP